MCHIIVIIKIGSKIGSRKKMGGIKVKEITL